MVFRVSEYYNHNRGYGFELIYSVVNEIRLRALLSERAEGLSSRSV